MPHSSFRWLGTNGPPRAALHGPRCSNDAVRLSESGLLGRLDFNHFRHVVLQKILNSHFERGGRAGAAGARPLHVEIDHAVSEILEHDIAAILGHGRTDPAPYATTTLAMQNKIR